MKTIVLFLTTLLLSFNVFAGSCAQQVGQISGLDDTTKQTMIVKCEEAKLVAAKTTARSTTIDQIDKWSSISLKFAKAIGVAAQELGVAVDAFLKTDAGKLTAIMIGWQVLGEDITHAVGIILYLTVGSLFFHQFRKYFLLQEYTEDAQGKKVPVYSTYSSLDDSEAFFSVIAWVAQVVGLVILLATF